jgi:uncharacterized protein (DUF1778 family)
MILGRPPLEPEQRRTRRIPTMFTEAEADLIERAAQAEGVKVAAFIRNAALAKAKRAR